MNKKIIVNDYDGFRKLEGQQIVDSDPVEITAEGIQDFCRGTHNDEWIHWDRERCKDSPLGDLIAPGLYLPSLFPYMFWQVMEINIPCMIVKGIDRIRILKPVTIGSKIVGKAMVDKVLDRDTGIEVHYAIEFVFADSGETAAVCTFINRYWD
jgi:acyl dehydratase